MASFGSLNVDTSIWVPRMPRYDETLLADRVETHCGGKGANQAVAAARLGARVAMIGCVGTDTHGDTLTTALSGEDIDVSHVAQVAPPTGVAFPIVAPENVAIIAYAGANASTDASHADAARGALDACDVLLLQGEIGAEASRHAAEIARAGDAHVILNPAPFSDAVVDAVLPYCTVVIVNRDEEQSLGRRLDVATIVTLGAEGCIADGDRIPAFAAEVIDPTGAGDAFCGGVAVGIAEGMQLHEAARLGSAAGALAVGIAGAQPSLPTRAATDDLLTEA